MLTYEGASLSLKWDNWGIEHFSRNEEGIYVLQSA